MDRTLAIVFGFVCVATPAAAAAKGVDRVPQDYPTIQAAVTLGASSKIAVSPGRWAGAIVTRPVEIRGDNAIIDTGYPLGPLGVGFALPPAATGTTIEGFTFDCNSPLMDFGIFSSATRTGGNANDIIIQRNTFEGCVQGITNSGASESCASAVVTGGRRWLIEHNQFTDVVTVTDTGGLGGGL